MAVLKPDLASRVVGLGADVVEVARMRRVLSRTPTFATRVFTADERTYAESARDPAPRYAARFAAKEAVLKAMGLGIGGARLADIEVVRAESGAPSVRLYGRAAEAAATHEVTAWAISLSHTDTTAFATVLALRSTRTRDDSKTDLS